MPAVSAVTPGADLTFDSAHVLLVGLAPVTERNPIPPEFSELEAEVRRIPCVNDLAAQNRVMLIPGADFVALIFPNDFHLVPGTAAEIYSQCSQRIALRIGIHSGPVDITDRISGKGVGLARQLLECGDSGHILLSESAGLKLERMGGWVPVLHDYGYCRLPDGERLRVFSMRANGIGNPCLPSALQPRPSQCMVNVCAR